MCAVSVIYDYGRQIPTGQWTPDTYAQFQEIIRRLDELDRKLAQPECLDPDKTSWTAAVETRLANLEQLSDGIRPEDSSSSAL